MEKTRVLLNGRIYTVNASQPRAEAVVIKGSRIIYVEDNKGVEKYITDGVKAEDPGGRLVTPGLTTATFMQSCPSSSRDS